MPLTDRAAGREALRRLSFFFQDGMVLAATLRGLAAIDLLAPTLDGEGTLATLRPGLTKPGFGHVRVGLRTLAQAGWLEPEPAPGLTPEHTTVRWTAAGRAVTPHHARFIELGAFLATFTDTDPASWTQPWEGERATRFAALVDAAAARWELDDLDPQLREQTSAQLDGALVSPVLLWLDATGGLPAATGPALPDGEHGELIARLLTTLGWIDDDTSAWTDAGRHGLDFVAHLGLVGAYLPLFARLPELYRGALTATYANAGDDREWHIQREMALRATGAAHGRYFADADPIVTTIFDREPLHQQPRFVVATGCGDGAWLVHIDALVRTATLRGRHLQEHPLTLIGVERSEVAVARARASLAAAGIDGFVLTGDAGDPGAIRDELVRHGLKIEDGLHLHVFVDHDRRYSGGHAPSGGTSTSSGAYVGDDGAPLTGADVEADLSSHLARWAPLVARHGVIVLEAHCVAPAITARHLGALHSLAFDAYNGYSGQYPVERPAFIAAARRAGLRQAATGERRYPTTRPFVAVSLNHMLGDAGSMIARGDPDAPRRDTWKPKPGTDLRDGRGLHELVFDHGDLRHPRLWASASTSQLVTQTMDTLEERVETLSPGAVLRVLDYGTGTALAAIEMLKACRERGFEERLASRGVGFELHLVDIPSSWFAQGHMLVQESSWTQCHSLIGDDGRFRPLIEVTGGVLMDVVISSMVFHLIPPKALERVAASLAGITAPGGRLLWNAPDLGVPGPYAVPFHEPNRMTRAHWKKLLLGAAQPATPAQRDAVAAARLRAQDGSTPLIDDERANRRILPRPHTGEEVGDALRGHFAGEVTTQTHEIVVRETLDTLLVPSNQGEYLPEIEDFDLRSTVIEEIMRAEVLPVLRAGPAGTYGGYNVHWTFGDFRPLAG